MPVCAVAELVEPTPKARYLWFDSIDSGFFNGWDLASAMHPQTILAYGFNDRPLMPDHVPAPPLFAGQTGLQADLSDRYDLHPGSARRIPGGPGVSLVRRHLIGNPRSSAQYSALDACSPGSASLRYADAPAHRRRPGLLVQLRPLAGAVVCLERDHGQPRVRDAGARPGTNGAVGCAAACPTRMPDRGAVRPGWHRCTGDGNSSRAGAGTGRSRRGLGARGSEGPSRDPTVPPSQSLAPAHNAAALALSCPAHVLDCCAVRARDFPVRSGRPVRHTSLGGRIMSRILGVALAAAVLVFSSPALAQQRAVPALSRFSGSDLPRGLVADGTP